MLSRTQIGFWVVREQFYSLIPSLVATNQSEFQFDAQTTCAGCVRKTWDMAEITACICGDVVSPAERNTKTAVQCGYHGCETSWASQILGSKLIIL